MLLAWRCTLATAIDGWLLRRTTVLEGIALVIAGALLIYPATGLAKPVPTTAG